MPTRWATKAEPQITAVISNKPSDWSVFLSIFEYGISPYFTGLTCDYALCSVKCNMSDMKL